MKKNLLFLSLLLLGLSSTLWAQTTWNGSVSTDLSVDLNWDGGTAPPTTGNETIIIPSGVSNYPVLTSNVYLSNLTINSGASINLNGNLLSIGSSLNCVGTGYITGSPSSSIRLYGPSTNTLGMDQSTPGTTNAVSTFTMNSPGGVILNSNLSVTTNVDFLNGIITAPTSTSLLEFGAAITGGSDGTEAPGTSTNATDGSHVNGYVRKLGGAQQNFAFPVGDATHYQPVGVFFGGNGSGAAVVVKYFSGTPIYPYSLGTDITSVNAFEYWDIESSGTVTRLDVNMAWDDYHNPGSGTSNYTNTQVANLTGSTWGIMPNAGISALPNWVPPATGAIVAFEPSAGNTLSGAYTLASTDAGTVLSTAIWNGLNYIYWDAVNNWEGQAMPTSTSAALIPAGMPHYPNLTSDVSVGSLHIEGGSIINLSFNDDVGHTLTINESLTGAGTIEGFSDCSIVFSSTASGASTLTMSAGSNDAPYANLANLTLNGTGNVTLGYGLTVNQATTFGSSGHLAINGNTLTLNGAVTFTGTGNITGSPTSSLILNGGTAQDLNMDQATLGTTNSLQNITFNNSATVTLNTTLSMGANGITTLAGSGAVNSNSGDINNPSYLSYPGDAHMVRSGVGSFNTEPKFRAGLYMTYSNPSGVDISTDKELGVGEVIDLKLNNDGNITLVGDGIAVLGGELSQSGSGILDLDGHLLGVLGTYVRSGTGTITANGAGSTVFLENSSALTVPTGAFTGNTISNLSIGAMPNVTFSDNITVSGTTQFYNNGKLAIGGHTLTLNGDIDNSTTEGITGDAASSLVLGGSTAQTLSMDQTDASSISVANLTINNTGGVTLEGNATVATALVLNGSMLTVPASSTLSLGGAVTSTTGGSITASTTTSTVAFTNAVAQTLPPGAFTGNSLGNLTMNGAGGITLGGNLSVATAATFANGTITAPGTSSLLEFQSGATVAGASDASHVNGYVRSIGTGTFTYPVGDATNYQPVDVNLSANDQGMVVKYFATSAGTSPFTGGITSVNDLEYWDISPVTSATGTVKLYWDTYKNAGINNQTDVDNLLVAHLTGGNWNNEGAGTGTLPYNVAGGSLTSSNTISTWSPFTIGSNDPATVLPVTLVSFMATANGCTANLAWKTATELNSSYYGVEASTDAIHFSQVAKVASKNSPTGGSYHYGYALASGTTYFRLKAVDRNGSFGYSGIVSITATGTCTTGIQITVSPNPASNLVNIQNLDGGRNLISLWDINGKQLAEVSATGTTQRIDIGTYANGIFLLRITNASGKVTTLKVVKQ